VNSIEISKPIYKKRNEIGLKPTQELASLHDLNIHSIEMNEKNIGIFYYKFNYITLKEGIFKKCETDFSVTYKKIRDLNKLDLEKIKRERGLSIEKATMKKVRRESEGINDKTRIQR
jgi:hypothetical protein